MNTYIITGASSDIGVRFLETLESDLTGRGEQAVALCQYRSHDEQLKALKNKAKHLDLRLFCCDLASVKATEDLVEEWSGMQIVPTHVLHLAAAKFGYMRLKQFDWETTEENLHIQVNSLAQIFKRFLPIMSKQGYGKVAVMLTAYTIGVPPKYMSDYLIAKYALLGLLRSAASEYGGSGITVNGLSPNMIETKFLSGIDPRVVEMTAQNSTMRRNVHVDEIVDCLGFLLSDKSNYLNGVNLNMTGGDRMA